MIHTYLIETYGCQMNVAESNAIEFIIHNLRKKVGSENIRNVRGVGWKVVKGN